jgi:methionyl-tRNA formyltransferase
VRTVFLGTSGFAEAVLERLARTEHRPTLVVTRPHRPRGRGRKVAPPPVAEGARALGIELLQPDSVNHEQARARIGEAQPEAVCVCAFGALIKEPLLSEHSMLNVHPSLLPRWRGAAPIERAIMAGDERTGVSIMRVTAGLDSGPVCLSAAEPIRPQDTFGSLSARLAGIGGELLVEALDTSPAWREQDDELATYADRIEAADRLLDPSRPAIELERTVRALHPHIGARLPLPGGDPVLVHAAAVVPDGPAKGELVGLGGRMVLGCADGALELLVVQPAGGRAMPAGDYLRGHTLPTP